jgi:hypothetical protein
LTFGQTNPFFNHDKERIAKLVKAFDTAMWRIITNVQYWAVNV